MSNPLHELAFNEMKKQLDEKKKPYQIYGTNAPDNSISWDDNFKEMRLFPIGDRTVCTFYDIDDESVLFTIELNADHWAAIREFCKVCIAASLIAAT